MRGKSTRSFGARNWKDAFLEADTIIAHEIPRKTQRDTRRSWRFMRSAVALLCAGVAAFAGYMGSDDPGNSKAEIAEFKSSVAGYINSIQLSANDPFAGAFNGPPLGRSPDFELILNGSPMPAPVVWNADVSAAASTISCCVQSLR